MRFRKHKPYRCPRLRVIPWYENAWILAKRFGWLLLGIVGTVLSVIADLLTHLTEGSRVTTWDGNRFIVDDITSDTSIFDSDTFLHEDDDMIRGQWDMSSAYYSICHPDED